MDAYVTEEQQWESVKRWINQNSKWLFRSFLCIVLVLLGGIYWRHHQSVLQTRAGDTYAVILSALGAKNHPLVKSNAEILMQRYPRTTYASLAALALANTFVSENVLEKAEAPLRWAMTKSQPPGLSALARVRLVRLLLAEDRVEEALSVCDTTIDAGFGPMLWELKGDILMRQKEKGAAKAAYEHAYKMALTQGGLVTLPLQTKIEALGGKLSEKLEEVL